MKSFKVAIAAVVVLSVLAVGWSVYEMNFIAQMFSPSIWDEPDNLGKLALFLNAGSIMLLVLVTRPPVQGGRRKKLLSYIPIAAIGLAMFYVPKWAQQHDRHYFIWILLGSVMVLIMGVATVRLLPTLDRYSRQSSAGDLSAPLD